MKIQHDTINRFGSAIIRQDLSRVGVDVGPNFIGGNGTIMWERGFGDLVTLDQSPELAAIEEEMLSFHGKDIGREKGLEWLDKTHKILVDTLSKENLPIPNIQRLFYLLGLQKPHLDGIAAPFPNGAQKLLFKEHFDGTLQGVRKRFN